MKKWIALFLSLSTGFTLSACGNANNADVKRNEYESQAAEETESQIVEEVFDPATMYGEWTLNWNMPDDDDIKSMEIRLEPDQLIMVSEDGNEIVCDCVLEDGYMTLRSADGSFYEGTYSSTDEGVMDYYVENYQMPEVTLEKIAEFTDEGESGAGFSGRNTIAFYEAVHNPNESFAHPGDSSAIIDLPSDLDSYYILPFEVTTENTTEGYDSPAQLQITVQGDNRLIAGSKDFEVPKYIADTVLNLDIRAFFYSDQSWKEEANDGLPAVPVMRKYYQWDNFSPNQPYRALGYLVIENTPSPKYPDGLPFYAYPSLGVHTRLAFDNQPAVFCGAFIAKDDDGTSTGKYVIVDSDNQDKLKALDEKGSKVLETLDK